MAGAATKTFSDQNFSSDVLSSAVPVLVDFWAPWCGPCKMIAPVIDELASESVGKFVVGKMNVDDSPLTPSKYGVSAIPTIMVFKNGEVVNRFTGLTAKEELRRAMEAAG